MREEKFDNVSGSANTKLIMAFFQGRNMGLEIAQYVSHPTKIPSEPRSVDAYGYNMIALDVEDLELVRDKLLTAGGTMVSEPKPGLRWYGPRFQPRTFKMTEYRKDHRKFGARVSCLSFCAVKVSHEPTAWAATLLWPLPP